MASSMATVDIRVIGQPQCCRELVAAGWKFMWISDVGFVAAEHPLGGKQSIVEVKTYRKGFEADQIGEAIAMLLNGVGDDQSRDTE